MMRLKKYIRPYLGYALAIVFLLFCQSAVDLNLPNLMSDIVNVGIQQGGITEAAPAAISGEALALMARFMTPEQREAVFASYEKAEPSAMSDRQWADFVKKYPEAGGGEVYRFQPADRQAEEAAESAFRRAGYALMSFAREAAPGEGQPETGRLRPEEQAMSLERLRQLLPLLGRLPEEKIDAAIRMAGAAPEEMLSQTAVVFTKGFYKQLGVNTGAIQNRYILQVGGKMLLMALLLTCFALGVGFCASKLGTGVARDLRRDVFAKVTGFTNREYDRFGAASLITRTTNDVMQVRALLSGGLRVMFYAPIIGIGGAVMALRKSPSMAWIIALAGILIFGAILVVFSIVLPRFKKMQQYMDKLNLVSRENLSGMMVIRAFSTQKFEEERFAEVNGDLARNNRFVFRSLATMMPTMTLLMNGVSLLIVWVGGHQIASASMQVGDMMAFIQYTMQIIMSFLMISMIFVLVPRAAVSANRIADVLESRSSVEDRPQTKHLTRPVRGEIGFHDVSFRYEGADENVLEHISFTARPGQTTAFIGSTGSGKSTLINLIPRFYDVTGGSITLDGVDIRELPQQELRQQIGYVPQKGVLFSGDIASNLRYGGSEAPESRLREAVEVAQAAEFVDELPEGLSTAISQGGTNVSGGQRQRLSIARALVKGAPVYIFDDTFSALDFKTDAKLRQALKTYTADAAVLIVAQRVSTILHADQIVVLEDGRVAGIGTHSELLKTCSTYREIAESQLSKEELA